MNKKILIFTLLTNLSLYPATLDELGLRWGTDKSSAFHHYTKIYEKYFSELRKKPIKFLEIGFSTGASAHMWEEYFEHAQLYFMDINPETVNLLQNFKRTKLYLVDQGNPAELLAFIQDVGGDFDIIIDDGGHTMNQQIISFKTLFPSIKSGRNIYYRRSPYFLSLCSRLWRRIWLNQSKSGNRDPFLAKSCSCN